MPSFGGTSHSSRAPSRGRVCRGSKGQHTVASNLANGQAGTPSSVVVHCSKIVQLAAIAARHSMAIVSGSKGYRQRARVLDMIRPRNVGAAHLIASAPFIFCVRQTAPFGRNRASRNPRSQRSPQHGRVDHGAYGSSTIYRGVQNLQDFGPGREMPEDPSDMEHQLFWSTCRPLQVWLCYTGSRKSL